MPSFNPYAAMFRKIKDILANDERTSQYKVFGGEYSKKKVLPAILLFPENKTLVDANGERNSRLVGIPKQFAYTFNFWCYVSLTDLDDAYYNEFDGPKAGLTQVLTEVEEVLKDHKTAVDLNNSNINLWFDILFSLVEISQKPGKLMHGKLAVQFIRKELS